MHWISFYTSHATKNTRLSRSHARSRGSSPQSTVHTSDAKPLNVYIPYQKHTNTQQVTTQVRDTIPLMAPAAKHSKENKTPCALTPTLTPHGSEEMPQNAQAL